jgi:rRNA maturation endonuclease Nob1
LELILVVVVLFIILYFVIKHAIDNSETAENIQFIRDFLEGKTVDKIEQDIDENYDIAEIPINQCPACLSEVSPDDKECPSCGLNLGD